MLSLGSRGDGGADEVVLPEEALLRHVLALGSSGSGKTVFCKGLVEEAARAGVPVIAVDLRGDVVSLALFGDEVELVRRGIDKEATRAFHERAEVVVFTPGSRSGIPLHVESKDAGAVTGARRLLFTEGVPIDAATLLGKGVHSTPGRTRVSIVYLGALASQEDRSLVVATLVDRLRRWVRRNPSPTLQAVLCLDEIAPFVPKVAEPPEKEAFGLLLDEAGEHGLGCVMATQHSDDVDHEVLGRPGTLAIGFTSPQDVPKIIEPLRAHAPTEADAISERLSSLGPGELLISSPDFFDAPVPLRVRWLYSDHRTVDEEGIGELVTEEKRARFAPLMRLEAGNEDPTRSVVNAPPRPEAPTPVPPAPDPPKEAETEEEPVHEGDAPEAFSPSAPTLLIRPGEIVDRRDDPMMAQVMVLAEGEPLTVKEFASRTGISKRKARRVLADLLESGDVRRYKDGRSYRYWATASGGRPDLSLPSKVATIAATLGAEDAEKLGEEIARATDSAHFESAELVHRLLYRVELRRGQSVYLHPASLDVLLLSDQRVMRFVAEPGDPADAVGCLDGVAFFVDVPPGALTLEDQDWEGRASEEEVSGRVAELFGEPGEEVTPVFVPVWRLSMTTGGDAIHQVFIDAVVGRPVTWA